MIKKLQVLVREVWVSEETEEKIVQKYTGEEVSAWDFKSLPDEEKVNYERKEVPTGKEKVETTDNDPVYGQIFTEEDLDVRDLILHLNRTR